MVLAECLTLTIGGSEISMHIKINQSRDPHNRLSSVEEIKRGSVTLIDKTRVKEDGLVDTLNLLQYDDFVYGPRWGRKNFGSAVSESETELLGVSEFIQDRGLSTEEKKLVAVGGSGTLYTSVDAGQTWEDLGDELHFPGGHRVSFLQVRNELYITSGHSDMVRYDGEEVKVYSDLAVPTGLALARSGVSDGAFASYFQVTALNAIGETAGCAEVSITHEDRSLWTGTNGINATWTAVSGAVRYQIYWADESGYEMLVGSSQANSFRFTKDHVPNPYIITPVDSTTSAPRYKKLVLSGNRIWGIGDPSNPYRVGFTGVGQYLGYFSAFYGGGWVDLEFGGREIVSGVVNYRSPDAHEVVTVFTSTPEGTGSTWQVPVDTITVGDLTFSLPMPTKIIDYVGATSADAVVPIGGTVIFPNANGVFDLANREQLYNVLISRETSQLIRPSYRAIPNTNFPSMTGYFYDAKVFFSAGRFAGEANDIVFIYDTERGNMNYFWDFGVRQFLEVTGSDGRTHFLYVPTEGVTLVELSEAFDTDFGQAFMAKLTTGLLGFGASSNLFAKVTTALFELTSVKGQVSCEVLGITKQEGYHSLATETLSNYISTGDFTSGVLGSFLLGSGGEAPTVFTQATVKKRVRINERLGRVQFSVSSNSRNAGWKLLSVQAFGRLLSQRMPNEWL